MEHLRIGIAVAVHALGLIGAVMAIFTARTAQGATAWAVALLAFPYAAVPLYAIFGLDRFAGYVRARQFADAKLRQQVDAEQAEDGVALAEADRYGLKVFERLAGAAFSRGNAAALLIDGTATFDAILREIDGARAYVLVEFYIIRDDALGRRLLAALAAAVRRGVKVRLLYDAIGSHGLTRSYRQALDQAGVVHGAFRSTRSLRSRLQANFRNHRKIVVVDGRTAFIGGHNVGDEYLGLDPKIGAWRDTHLQLDGAVALQAQLTFVEDWHWTRQEIPDFLTWRRPAAAGDTPALVLASGPVDSMVTCAAMYAQAITVARERFWLTTPYFIPDPAMMTALRLARLRGVDVRLILTGRSDNALSDLASSTYLPDALRAGARLFKYQQGFLHEKTFVVDETLAAVGSANFDVRSFRLNFEITALVFDEAFARSVAAMHARDMERSEEVFLADLEGLTLLKQLPGRVARLLTPVL